VRVHGPRHASKAISDYEGGVLTLGIRRPGVWGLLIQAIRGRSARVMPDLMYTRSPLRRRVRVAFDAPGVAWGAAEPARQAVAEEAQANSEASRSTQEARQAVDLADAGAEGLALMNGPPLPAPGSLGDQVQSQEMKDGAQGSRSSSSRSSRHAWLAQTDVEPGVEPIPPEVGLSLPPSPPRTANSSMPHSSTLVQPLASDAVSVHETYANETDADEKGGCLVA